MLLLSTVLPAMVILKHWENVAKNQNLCLDIEKNNQKYINAKKKKKIEIQVHAVFVSISDNF